MRFKVLLALLLLVAVIVGILFWSQPVQSPSASSAKQQTYSDKLTGGTLTYPDELTPQNLTSDDQANGYVLRLAPKSGGILPPLQVAVSVESGLKAIAELSHKPTLDAVLDNTDLVLAKQYKGYHLVSRHKLSNTPYDAAEIIFDYSGESGQSVRQRLLIALKNDDVGLYLSAQTKQTDFTSVNSKTFDPIFNSISFLNLN